MAQLLAIGAGGIIGIIAGAVVLILLIVYISLFNSFARTKVKVHEAESGIDVALTKRYDVLTKTMDVVKSYAKHEVETLTKVINLRKGMSMEERAEAHRSMEETQRGINVLAEAYPQLLSSENYKNLQKAVLDVEEHLQAARRAYNANVSHFNQMLITFPSSLVGKIHGHKKFDFFEADQQKRADVKIDLNY